jgi:hypothetical protein
VNHQPDLYGEVPEPVVEVRALTGVCAPRAAPVKGAPNLFVELRPAHGQVLDELIAPAYLAYRVDPERAVLQLARFLSAGAQYRVFRALCGHAVVVSAAEWRTDAEQWPCRYRACASWVQRDSQRIEGESWNDGQGSRGVGCGSDGAGEVGVGEVRSAGLADRAGAALDRGGDLNETDRDQPGGVARGVRGTAAAAGGAAGWRVGLVDGPDGGEPTALQDAQEPPEWLEDY